MTEQPAGNSIQNLRKIPARDGEEMAVMAGEEGSNGQDWLGSWHPSQMPPAGTPHGSSAICVTSGGDIVLISQDGRHWDLPAGRPEGNETWEETLRRELLEEACATVSQARLLGFCRSACVAGPQVGEVLVRSMWRADVELAPWEPQFEILHRRLVLPAEVIDQLTLATGLVRLVSRALQEAAVL